MEIKIRRVAKECLLLMMLALMMAMVVNISRAARNNPHPVFDDAFDDGGDDSDDDNGDRY